MFFFKKKKLILINFMGLTKFKLKTIKSPINWLSLNKSHAWIGRIENMKIVSMNLSWKMCIIALKLVLLSLKLPFLWFEYMLESQILIFKITWFFRELMSSHSLGLIIFNWIVIFRVCLRLTYLIETENFLLKVC